jgi:hypothetical protein
MGFMNIYAIFLYYLCTPAFSGILATFREHLSYFLHIPGLYELHTHPTNSV